jgi:hypothetical protein
MPIMATQISPAPMNLKRLSADIGLTPPTKHGPQFMLQRFRRMVHVHRKTPLTNGCRLCISRRTIAEVSLRNCHTGKPCFSHSLHVPFSIPSELRNIPKSFINQTSMRDVSYLLIVLPIVAMQITKSAMQMAATTRTPTMTNMRTLFQKPDRFEGLEGESGGLYAFGSLVAISESIRRLIWISCTSFLRRIPQLMQTGSVADDHGQDCQHEK